MKKWNTKQVGWVGLGQMGEPMVTHLLNQGVEVGVYNRHPEKCANVVGLGAKAFDSVRELVSAYEVIFLMVADYAAVQAVLNEDVLAHLKGKLVVNMSTISPEQNQAVETLLAQYGADFVEAPVSGSSKVAEAGKLLVLSAGDLQIIEQIKPLFAAFSTTTFYYGEVGKAGGVKLMINSLLGIFIQAYGEALLFAQQYGISKEQVIELISGSAMNTAIFQAKVPMYLQEDFSPAFMLKHMAKDFQLTQTEMTQKGVSLPLIEQASQSYQAANNMGLSEIDMAGIYQFLAKQ